MLRALVLISIVFSLSVTAEEPTVLLESRALVFDFQKTLGGKLKSAMEQGGTQRAIAVCSEQAPKIAAEMSKGRDFNLGRVSQRVRNADNSANDMESQVLEQFAKSLASDKPALEYFKTGKDGSALYMKAIVIQPLCLSCHGETLAEETQQALSKYYPKDKARGYKQGDLRGAFVVRWSAPGQ